jgi:transcriptional regulator with XRE-family HTH domain
MTPDELRATRKANRLTQRQLADLLRIADAGTIKRYEAGLHRIPGPVALLVELLRDGKL